MKQPVRSDIIERHNLPTEKPIYTLLIDGNALFKRSLSTNKKRGDNGAEYGGVFNSLLQIRVMLAKKDFDYVYCFFDNDGSGYLRYQYYNDYKRTRGKHYENYGVSEYFKELRKNEKRMMMAGLYKKSQTTGLSQQERMDYEYNRQRPILQDILEELYIRQIPNVSLVEGDDLIAYYVLHKKPNEKIIIMTGDMDLTQLIAEDVAIYNLNTDQETMRKYFITADNSVDTLGFTYKNTALIKTICGDSSDNIGCIQGFGGEDHKTLFKFFPKMQIEEYTLDRVIEEAKVLNEEWKATHKQKGNKNLEAIINGVTTWEYKGNIYEINEKIIDLKKPIMTEEAIAEMDAIMYAPISIEDRSLGNVMKIVLKNGMTEFKDEDRFASFFGVFDKIANKEKRRYAKALAGEDE